jgi:hypothetical protein
MPPSIDTILAFRNRTLRTLPGKLLLGPTGARLWADYLDPVPGFRGRIDFIHKLNIPLLFSVDREGGPEEMLPLNSLWRPSMLEMDWEDGEVLFKEYKFITWEDQALSAQRWENRGPDPLVLRLTLPGGFAPPSPEGWTWAELPVKIHGIEPVCVFHCPPSLRGGSLVIPPGEAAEFVLAMAVGNRVSSDREQMKRALLAIPGIEGKAAPCVEYQRREYLRWFDRVPRFTCSDPLLEKTWWYRWFILRHNCARPDCGNFRHTLFYEGRSHKMGKEIYRPGGWEFSKLIPLSTPLHITDLRWHGDGELAREAARSLCDSMDEKGLFRVLFADEAAKEYANYAGWALYLLYQVHRDRGFIQEALGSFKKYVRGVYRAHKAAGDHLQIETQHSLTGKEYQPSYWYFTGYPGNAKDKTSYVPLKRVDRSIYAYLNALGIARLCAVADDPGEAEFVNLAEQIRRDILEKMWDPELRFFCDLHHETGEKAPVKNIVGIYPLWADITGPEHAGALDSLFDPGVFDTGSGFASVGRDCPVFSPSGGWKGQYFKGRDGCMWNGPSWPYTTGIALDAIALQTKRRPLGLDRQFLRLLRSYSFQHFQGGDLSRPYLVEHYNSVTGEPLSDEADYNHSFYIDLIVRHLAGIEPAEDGFRFRPLRLGLKSFSLEGLHLQGRRIDINCRPAGVRVSVDGKPVYENPELPDRAVSFGLS